MSNAQAGRHRFESPTTLQPSGSLSLSCLTDQSSNPTKHKLLTPPPTPTPTPQKSGTQVRGVEGSKSKFSLGNQFVLQNYDFTRG